MNKGNIEQIGTPGEIYQHPKTEFVFQFIGKSTRLDGVIKSVDRERIHVQIQSALVVTVDPNNIMGEDHHLKAGDEVKLYIRPEKISLHPAADQPCFDSDHKGIITQMNYLGSAWEVEVSLLGEAIQSLCTTVDPAWSVGSEVYVGWQPSDLMLIKK
ncbi:TOBE domain-containing protein [Brevibacillus massiliensis]|jgi:ABC-type Fe3+/spermidine/putrescine transport system ATPase subunit|uniref:TOBE domain-containing protein n=1 Tax=Brevibacillus massiliensis TaxID=1118054 RepID=UPI000307062F|nr:TOBE domain-containing protein [Brevibacillus massiliensis]